MNNVELIIKQELQLPAAFQRQQHAVPEDDDGTAKESGSGMDPASDEPEDYEDEASKSGGAGSSRGGGNVPSAGMVAPPSAGGQNNNNSPSHSVTSNSSLSNHGE